MKTIIKYTIVILISFNIANVAAQDSNPETRAVQIKQIKNHIKNEEKEALKIEVKRINDRVINKELTYKAGEDLKQEVAKKHALNIENRIVILQNKLEFNDRNGIQNDLNFENEKSFTSITFGNNKSNPLGLKISNSKRYTKPIIYDFRTLNGLVLAAGLNNAIIDNQSLSNSPYKIGGSGFFELGFQWRTRLLKNSNLARLRYGLSLQWNKYDLKDNKYFVQYEDITTLETFPVDLKKAKFRITNLVVPIYLEFGQHRKIEKKDRVRFTTKGFKGGFGGYAGLNIGAKQKLKYKDNGIKTKQKIKQDYNVNPFVYGVGGYLGYDDISLIIKYDLSNTFRANFIKQNNISLGIRYDIE